MGTGILPEEQGPGGPEKAVFRGRTGRTGTAEEAAGRIILAITFPFLYNERKRSVISMFCPHCGTYCSNSDFCTKCGMKLSQKRQSIREQPDNDNLLPTAVCDNSKTNIDIPVIDFDLTDFMKDVDLTDSELISREADNQCYTATNHCPKCKSKSYCVDYEDPWIPNRWLFNNTPVRKLIYVCFMVYKVKHRKVICTCNKCGCRWQK